LREGDARLCDLGLTPQQRRAFANLFDSMIKKTGKTGAAAMHC
jgi:hypothetical protein